MTLIEELNKWLDNYEILLKELMAAYRFKNKQAIDDIGERILVTQREISKVSLQLKEKGYAYTYSVVGTSVNSNVQVRKHTPLNFDCIDRDRTK